MSASLFSKTLVGNILLFGKYLQSSARGAHKSVCTFSCTVSIIVVRYWWKQETFHKFCNILRNKSHENPVICLGRSDGRTDWPTPPKKVSELIQWNRISLKTLTVKKLPEFYGTRRYRERIHKVPPNVSNPSQINPVHVLASILFETHFNIIIPSTSRSSKWSPSFTFPHQHPSATRAQLILVVTQQTTEQKTNHYVNTLLLAPNASMPLKNVRNPSILYTSQAACPSQWPRLLWFLISGMLCIHKLKWNS